MNVRFSELAILKLDLLSDFLIEKWSVQSYQKFLLKLDARIQSIINNPLLFPESQAEPGLRKCVVTKQTSLLYEIQDDSIFILTIIDNRQDQDRVNEEIDKHFAN